MAFTRLSRYNTTVEVQIFTCKEHRRVQLVPEDITLEFSDANSEICSCLLLQIRDLEQFSVN